MNPVVKLFEYFGLKIPTVEEGEQMLKDAVDFWMEPPKDLMVTCEICGFSTAHAGEFPGHACDLKQAA